MSVETDTDAPFGRDLTLTQRIRVEIEAKILSGHWRPGDRIPFEHELMAQYSCARMTVSKAMSMLAESGLIERRRRAGTFVRRPAGQSAVLQIPDIPAELAKAGKTYSFEILARRERVATPDDLRRLGEKASGRVLALTCLHRADGAPYAFEDRLIALDAVPIAASETFEGEPPGTWLLHHVPWQEAEHVIAAEAANAATARHLGIEPGGACLAVERRTWSSGRVLTSVRIWFPGAVLRLIARFTPSAG